MIVLMTGCGVKTVGTNSDKQTLITSTLLKINFFREVCVKFVFIIHSLSSCVEVFLNQYLSVMFRY